MGMNTADELLAKAKATLAEGRANYRDAMIEVGGTLHDFVLARLREGDEFGYLARVRKKITRERVMAEAAAALGVSATWVALVVWTAQIVRLLGGGDCGGLLFKSLLKFKRLIVRELAPTANRQHRKGEASLAEQWRVRPGFEESGPALFRRAAEGGWSSLKCEPEVAALLRSGGVGKGKGGRKKKRADAGARHHAPTAGQHDAPDRHAAAALASAGDVAEMCMELVRASADPWAVAQRLLPELQRIKRPRATAC